MSFSDPRLKRLLRLGREMSVTLELRSLLHAVLNAAIDLTASETASVLEYDEAGRVLRFVALPRQHRKNLEGMIVPLEGSLAGMALRERQPVSVNDVAQSLEHFKGSDELSGYVTRSVLAVPLLAGDRPVGVLEVVNKRGQANYNGDDATILESLASQLALAFENDSLRRQVAGIREDAARLDRMKGNFIAITSHELRTPLGLILGHSTFLREIVGVEYREQLDTIIRSATRLKEIIESMTSVDNVQNGTSVVQRRAVSVRKILQEQIQRIQPELAPKNLNLRADVSQHDLMVEGDAEKIGSALSNLLKNAVTFTNPGGHVFVVAEQLPGYVKVSVIDNGIGIPAKDLPHIFERFYQVESHLTRKHGGMGLGLSVARMMAEMHGGSLSVESVEGKGSNFTLLLPLDSSQAQAAGKVFVE
ncbi:MAG: hypothetical protein CO094_05470 [Anaerolineae bacterium CG_4_9_14_3_um_filter_57_17]|nr:GAF domain-containing protein [bacterium]NCT20383.1 GAF domain-containing protein [bacterium]OIO87352.1 MAG: hypothetical protein AUK01_00540 [Anaerolineae bacterium CG2_30_57_67]PJB66989.1 MAG: hypothetical protein CO094_05470 [Anaerolineae bacterium CG_4_9_14_3_um_filter_57_17]